MKSYLLSEPVDELLSNSWTRAHDTIQNLKGSTKLGQLSGTTLRQMEFYLKKETQRFQLEYHHGPRISLLIRSCSKTTSVLLTYAQAIGFRCCGIHESVCVLCNCQPIQSVDIHTTFRSGWPIRAQFRVVLPPRLSTCSSHLPSMYKANNCRVPSLKVLRPQRR